ncbi:STT3 domain-containing protein [Promethearchaeum syntrophicum]|uniref:dolichyl-phosphooligosaccharide-protein glycotransferase n=1 Tax=Promethearchaeum syntrophicum TaxID=2594042 RepID=A0A5B9D8D6_9ARCH|nr:STT3 domain-containing protein [Candidatus Prometheoarchaeum syntrophicum]QEE15342.1 Oligosaccharyl transferase STT3 subunit [Candidatus Prometheoarchaeum syntrophicum]
MVNKFKNWFSNQSDKVKTSVKIPSDAPFFYLALIFVLILAVLVRMSPVITGTYLIKAFDPWYQFSSTKAVINMSLYDWFHFHDFQFWFPEGVDRFNLRPGLLFTTAIIYWIITALGIPVTPFQVAFYFPAFMGGATVLVMYFLGKEILDKRAGLIAAFFLAFSPGHMQRTVCGFYDNETIGVFAVLLVFLFFIKAVKSGKLSHGIYAGISLGYLALSWGGLTYPFLLIPLLVAILILANKYNARILLAYSATIGIGLLIFTLDPSFAWSKMIKEMDFIVPLLFLVFLIGYHIMYMQRDTEVYTKILTGIKWASIPIAIIALIIFWQVPDLIPFNLASRLASIINPSIREDIHLVASVGEHAPAPWSAFYYNSLIPLLLVVPGVYFAIRRGNTEDILMVIFVVTLFYFTGSMIRIILLFAPALALLGGYALSNILKMFGNLMKKEKTITRRRKKQLKRTIAKPEGLIVYAMIGLLLFVQANHAITISSEQMGYSDLVSLGSFHDWEESLTWMDNNLPSEAVVVSWWDYGYWITSIGNVTSVNDNGTWNQTRIGLTGMAMMQTQERYSAEAFKLLKAEYVLVYFGHLVTGIGGDEGKWPWMVRICNDNTASYENYGSLTKDNWYGGEDQTVDTVFDEEKYINGSSGLYREAWFNSTLAKLLFNNELISADGLSQTDSYPIQQLAIQVGGYPEGSISPKVDDNGKLWKEYPTVNGDYQLEFFEPTYVSANKLVKLYKIDYTPLDTSFSISKQNIDTNGYGNALITNTGKLDFEISSLKVSDKAYNFSVENSADPISPNESRYVWFNTEETWDTSEIYNLEMEVSVQKENGLLYTLSNDTVDTQVKLPDEIKIEIDRESSRLELSGFQSNAKIVVKNEGNQPQKISNISINNDYMEINPDLNLNLIIGPNETESFYIEDTGTATTFDFSESNYIRVHTSEGGIAETVLGFNKENYKLTILPSDLDILPESRFLFDYSIYENMNIPHNEYYLNYNAQSYLLENGSLTLTVRNDGFETIGLESLYANGVQINDFIVGTDTPEELFLDPGDQRNIYANVSEVERNSPVSIYISGQDGDTCASDNAYFVPRNQSSMISIITGENSMTSAFTNESLRLVVKNVGFDPVELDSIILNGTEAIEIQDVNITVGNKILNHDDIALIDVSFDGFKLNLTNTLNVMVNTTSSPFVFSDVNLTSRLPTADNITRIIDPDEIIPHENYGNTMADASEDSIHLMLSINHNTSATIDGIRLKIGISGDFQYLDISSSDITMWDNLLARTEITDYILTGSESGNLALYYIDIANIAGGLTTGETIWVQVITSEGYEDIVEITVSA